MNQGQPRSVSDEELRRIVGEVLAQLERDPTEVKDVSEPVLGHLPGHMRFYILFLDDTFATLDIMVDPTAISVIAEPFDKHELPPQFH